MDIGQLTNMLTTFMLYALIGSLIVERGLATVYNWSLWETYCSGKGIKGPFAFIVSLGFVIAAKLDIVTYIFQGEGILSRAIGYFLTALIVAAGSKGMSALWGDMKKATTGTVKEPTDSQQE